MHGHDCFGDGCGELMIPLQVFFTSVHVRLDDDRRFLRSSNKVVSASNSTKGEFRATAKYPLLTWGKQNRRIDVVVRFVSPKEEVKKLSQKKALIFAFIFFEVFPNFLLWHLG